MAERRKQGRIGRGAALLVLVLLAGACTRSAPQASSAVLVTLDTTRADALSCYGGRPGLTPVLDRIAAEGTLYENARTVAPITLPAHVSMWTGLYPPRHAVRDNGLNPLPEEAVTLAEEAQAAGVRTAAFVSAAVLDAAFGLDQGFEVYEGPARSAARPRGGGTHFAERPAQETVRSAIRWLRRIGSEEPLLLWVHLFEPHAPYVPTPEALARAGGHPYLGEVALVDDAVGLLIAELERLGRLESSLVVVTSDHGEGLGEHGESTHTVYCYDTTLRVPLLVRYPDGFGAGERSQELVSVVDVYATLRDALGLAEVDRRDGRSLFRRAVPPERGAYFESFYGSLHYGWAPLVGWVDADGKSVHGSYPELFAPVPGPDEETDLAARRPEVLAGHRSHIQEVLAAPALRTDQGVEDQLLGQLRALGYVTARSADAGLPDPFAPGKRPDPRRRKQQLARFYSALEEAERGRTARAVELLQAIVDEDPGNPSARQYLAEYQVAAGNCEAAVPLLEDLLERAAERASNHLNLGFCLGQAGQNEAAVAHFERVLELDPRNAAALRNLFVVMKRLGRPERAAEYKRRFEALQVGRPPS